MNEENIEDPLDIPGYFFDKKKNRYFLIDNELKKQLKKEEFNKLINNAKKKNRESNVEPKKYVKKKFHQIHGLKEMKKKKKNANNNKSNIKDNNNINCVFLNKTNIILNNKEKNFQFINNELNFLKRNISENRNIYNIIKRIRNYNFLEDSILSLPSIFINSNYCEYIKVEDLCELSTNNNILFQKENKSLDNTKSPCFLSIKRSDGIDVPLNDFKCFNLSKKLIDENKRKSKLELKDINNEPFENNKKYRKHNFSSNKFNENIKNYNIINKNDSDRYIQDFKSNISFSCDNIEESLLIPKLYGRTYQKLNSYNTENIKSKIVANRYKANFYYFYYNYNEDLEGNNLREVNNNNTTREQNFTTFNNISNNTIYQETDIQIPSDNLPIRHFDATTNEARISKTFKPSESFFHLFSNPQYDDFIFSTTKENNFSFSLGAIDMNKFVQTNKKSPINDIIHENVYYSTDTKYLCSYSKEQSEILCISPQILSHFNIFNGEYVAYSSYGNTKDEKSLLCLLSIKSFFQCNPKIAIYSFISEINYFKLFPSMDNNDPTYNDNYTSNNNTYDEYSYHHNNKIDKIFICGSFPCFSFSTIKDDVTYCIWDSKKLKVHDLLSMNEDITFYIENILSGKQYPLFSLYENNSQKKLRFYSKKSKEKVKKENEKTIIGEFYENDMKKKNEYKTKNSSKYLNNDGYVNINKYEVPKINDAQSTRKLSYVNNNLSKNNSRNYSSINSNEKNTSKYNLSYNYYSPNSQRYNYNDNKKKGICCENVKKANNNIFLCCNTEYLYLCDLRCNFLNTISKLRLNEGYVNKIYSLNNNFQYILSKTNNHIGLYDMRYLNYKDNDETKSNLLVTYERFIDNNNLKKYLNDFYVIDNEQYIVSLDTYTNSVYIYDIMSTANRIINLDGNSDYSKNNQLHSYANLSRIPYIYSCNLYDDEYYNYYKKKIKETKATNRKYVNHFNPLKSYPKKDLFIGLNVQSILPLFYIKQKYNKHNFISINEGGFICTINI
ncbi:conserved Plasmodium protein, unknown function [Plasmodium gallinaceum]|uniref:Uncharacterized protein n=1 Tax=Plasmodium gallinaceum TaxID=5849 RepID=A0A1J1GQ12_PLAGA|nr:conserved Plasmodium protein, unknown function [Plasmodium gallinaceum]CRG93375.1 conserved Plasmodium protein, unknown function [Plasmodium gallinaceum]